MLWDKWCNEQDSKFMAVENDDIDIDQISQRDSYEEEDQSIEVSTKKILNKDGKLAIPEIHKHFAL